MVFFSVHFSSYGVLWWAAPTDGAMDVFVALLLRWRNFT